MAANERKKILFVASECVPFIKTGGLADVVGSLPKDIDPEYYDVRVMIPKYSCMKQDVKDQMEYVTHFYMDYHWKSEYVGVLQTVKNGITFYFIDNEGFFTSDKPYTDDPLFEITRFAFFSKACLSPRLADRSRSGVSQGEIPGQRFLPRHQDRYDHS